MTMTFFPRLPGATRSIAPFAVVGSLCVFTVLIGFAMEAYPGGTAWDATARGHDFWQNYLCDLEREYALNGKPNAASARLAQAAMLALATGAAPFWWTTARLLAHARLRVPVRVSGALSSLAVVGVAALPSDRFPSLHPVLLGLGGVAGLLAAWCSVIGLMKTERFAAVIGAATFAVAAVDLALYAWTLRAGVAAPVAVAILERVSLLLVLAWMAVVAWRSGVRSRA